ncbi:MULTISPECIES: peptidase U32 family protein [Acidiplasma]|jgi:collagenase-like PrtC family protease|uniref:Peptidase U32 n=3 Tax=Acidiplasma TaxID=507753 RepID=A0A0Q0S0E4_9ARCH|nr:MULTISPECIES: peptidase U32 family protein [Acidiplasma]KJE48919.1 peptidase U32 [Acidiplasma sp. MBA-1]KQB35192.1 peptidase U32 [Acidiplasma aeolicum]KQB36386.1 peptidase U32 [Acidiplasma cupricumulans]WMT54335.1 MAG: peptidase U32 family protein [Acidiplasma sp.]
MRLVVGTNFDDNLIEGASKYPVTHMFGSFKKTITGHGRAAFLLPDISDEGFKNHIELMHDHKIKFLYVMNSATLNTGEYSGEYNKKLNIEIDRLVNMNVDGFIVALPFLIKKIKRDYPDMNVSVSSFARVSSMREIEEYAGLGVNTIILHEDTTRDFKFLEAAHEFAMKNNIDLELITDNSCLFGCPYRRTHDIVSSESTVTGQNSFWFEYPIMFCSTDVLNDPRNIIKMRWIRPEDTYEYEKIGIDRFKIASRTKRTDWILRSIKAYSERNYDGNLLNLLSFPQGNAMPRVMEKINGPDNYRILRDVRIDNKKFPKSWINFFKYNDCNSMDCNVCKYCDKIADATMEIAGKSIKNYGIKRFDVPIELIPRFGHNETD